MNSTDCKRRIFNCWGYKEHVYYLCSWHLIDPTFIRDGVNQQKSPLPTELSRYSCCTASRPLQCSPCCRKVFRSRNDLAQSLQRTVSPSSSASPLSSPTSMSSAVSVPGSSVFLSCCSRLLLLKLKPASGDWGWPDLGLCHRLQGTHTCSIRNH